MSKERQRAREARAEQRRREVAAAAQARSRRQRRRDWLSRLRPSLPRRRRRYGALSTWALVQVVLLFLAVQVVLWWLLSGIGPRLAGAVLTYACLLVAVRTRKKPAR